LSRTVWTPIAMAFLLAAVAGAPAAFAEEDAAGTPPLIVIGDFNRDGVADVAEVAPSVGEESGPRWLTVLLGRGDGTFRQAAAIALMGRDPRSMVAADFSGDGNLDLIVGDGDGSLMELVGDGRGGFAAAEEIAHLGSVVSIAVADFNHDGVLDLAVSDLKGNLVKVLLGSGHGAFRAGWEFPTPMQGLVFHLATADFNGDGVADLVVTREDEEMFAVMLGNGNGTFTYAPALSKVIDPKAHCAT